MLRPTPGELLEGLQRELTDSVLPEVPAGAAKRQLRAAIHVLGKLAQTWDLQHKYVETDNLDLEVTLANLSRLVGAERNPMPADTETGVVGVSDRSLADAVSRNIALQRELEQVQRQYQERASTDREFERALFELHRRRSTRALAATGESP